MKKVTLSILCFVSVCVSAQSFKLYEVVGGEEKGEILNKTTLSDTCIAQEIEGVLCAFSERYVVFENTSDEEKVVVCQREIIHLVDNNNVSTSFCWGVCNDPDVSVSEKKVDAHTKTEVFGGFSAEYSAPSTVAGTSIIRYTFIDKDNAMDSISFDFEYVTIPNLHTWESVGNISLSVYPNPTADCLTVEMSDLQLKPAFVVVYDAIGKMVKTQSLTSHSTKVDVSNLEQGIYYLQIGSDSKRIGVYKFVKE